MRFSTFVAAFAPVVAVAAQQTFTVLVGPNGSNTYSPTSVNAAVGDTIAFQFQAKNHTVTQSTFVTPCQMMTTPAMGIDSGFMPVPAGTTALPQWSFTISNASTPLWFYCRQTGHCQQGMVFAVNPTATKTFAAFQAAAMASSSNGTPGAVTTPITAPGITPSSTIISATPSTAAKTGSAMKLDSSATTVLALMGIVAGVLLQCN